jgi:hypothetical protein
MLRLAQEPWLILIYGHLPHKAQKMQLVWEPESYTIVATDQFGCIDSAQYTVTEPTALSLGIASQTDATCNGGSNGTATLTVFGGSGNYQFLWNDASAQTSATATGLAAGTYTATVTDDSACVATTTVTIAEPTAITFATPTITAPLCFRSADGSIASSASGGTGQLLIVGATT